MRSDSTPDADPLWYKDAVIYQLHVKAYADSDGDGVGDFAGLTGKLDYLAGLGVTALWLLPFYPSPLRDDGYDIADYEDVHPAYGDLAAFRRFLREAHRRGLRVITELVINHTSDQHPWFQRARRAAPGTRARNFYVWSDTPERYREARIIFQDFEASNWSWDAEAGAYYWHRFYHHQPDLNFEEPAVKRAIFKVMDFWFNLGVDGMRLDAVPYLYEAEGTNCENLPATHALLKELRAHVDERFPGRMLLAEANQWPEDAIAYFGAGDECHMCFHFPLMPRLYMALHQEDRFPILDILEQTPEIPESCQWATFLRNHDELTLEMVTDEDRDSMVRVYAADPQARINLGIRRRLAPLLGNDRRRIELMNALLFSLPGAPVLYYGDEIGMGDDIYQGDRHGMRTPMQWSPDRNAGFSRANPQKLILPVIVDPEYHFQAINVEAQEGNARSLLWWMRRLIAIRRRCAAFSRGSIEFLRAPNHRVLAFVRRFGDERKLVVANLSRFAQSVELDPRAVPGLVGATPVEIFGRTPFPPMGERPYPLTLGPHDFFWFALRGGEGTGASGAGGEAAEPLPVRVEGGWQAVLAAPARERLEEALADYLQERGWLARHGRDAGAECGVALERALPLRAPGAAAEGLDSRFALVRVDYVDGEPETYGLPLALAAGGRLAAERPWSVVARLQGDDGPAALVDAAHDPGFWRALLVAIARRRRFVDGDASIAAYPTAAYRRLAAKRAPEELTPALPATAAADAPVVLGGAFTLRLFRRLEPGLHPDLELGRFLTEHAGFAHIPAVAGAVEVQVGRSEPATVAVLRAHVESQGDAWRFTLDALGRFFEYVATESPGPDGSRTAPPVAAAGGLFDALDGEAPPVLREALNAYPEWARLLGERTAGLHRALADAAGGDALAPEPFTTLYQRSLYQSMRARAVRALDRLAGRLSELPEASAAAARALLAARGALLERFDVLRRGRFDGLRIRVHGDLGLGRWLYTGRDFVLADCEGDPRRPLSERRIKRSPLVDVAALLGSLRAAARASLAQHAAGGFGAAAEELDGWAAAWARAASAALLRGYLEAAAGWPALPKGRERLAPLLDAYLLNGAFAAVGDALDRRPEALAAALRGALDLLEGR